MATIPNQNTAYRLSDVIDEGDAIIGHIRITILALHDSRAAPRPSVTVKRDLSPAGRFTPTLAV